VLSAEEREAYAEKNLKLAYWFANRYQAKFPGLELEEIKGYALLGLAVAVNQFDPEVGAAFSTFLGHVIFNNLRQAVRKPRVKTLSLETPIAEDLTLGETVFDKTNYEELAIDRLTREETWHAIPPFYRKILQAYADGMTQSEIGITMGISQAHISRILARTRTALLIERRRAAL